MERLKKKFNWLGNGKNKFSPLLSLCSKIKPEIKYILLFFVITRLMLEVIGFSSQVILEPYHGKYNVWHYSEHKVLDIWGVWDTGWYLGIAQGWYSPSVGGEGSPVVRQANYAFFPLYPALIRGLEYIVGDYFIASLIISNLALLIACWFLYKLVKIDYGEKTALRSIKYMLIYPVSFILSGAFTESLFLSLILASFYFAKINKWHYVGITGFFLTLTRSLGVFAVIPLFYIYLKNKNWQFSKISKKWLSVLWLGLFPLGLGVWMWYNYYLTGDCLAFAHIQEAWKREYGNPFKILCEGLISPHLHIFVSGAAGLSVLLLINIFAKKIGFAYWLLGMYSILIPLSSGIYSLPRFTLVVFPIFIIFAILGKNKNVDQVLTIALAILLGFFMVFWADGFMLII